jgi:hypothetical protein
MHGQFVIMGGFLLFQDDRPVQVLSPQKFTDLLDSACIDFPSIPKDEIKGKEVRSRLLAAITLLQTLWFFTQCIARGVRGLASLSWKWSHCISYPLTPYSSSFGGKNLSMPATPFAWNSNACLLRPCTSGAVWKSDVHRDFGRHRLLIGKQLKAFRTWSSHSTSKERSIPLQVPFSIICGAEEIHSHDIWRNLFDFGQLFIPEELDGEIISDGLLEVPTFYAPGSLL